MRGLFQGGNCNPLQTNSNQFKRMMEGMMLGNNNAEKILDFSTQGMNMEGQMQNRQAMFRQMNQMWGQQEKNINLQQKQMEQMYMQQQFEYMRQMEHMQQMQWLEAEQKIKNQQLLMNKQFENVSLEHEAENWQKEMLMENKFQETKVGYEEEQQRIKNSTGSMLEVMMTDEDPRFKNSEFLQFLKKLNTGELQIRGQQLVEHPLSAQQQMKNAFDSSVLQNSTQQALNQKLMEEKYGQAIEQHKQMELNMQNKFKEAENDDIHMKKYQEQWTKRLQEYEDEYKNTVQFEAGLEKKYMDVLKEMDLDMTQAWQSASDLEEQKVYGDFNDKYRWSENNPFNEVAQPLALAMEFINKGRNNQAIFALEAHLKKNQNDSESWRVLGRILQENDQDQKSVPCFTNALKVDPGNLDALLYLGISCTNILDEVKAMNFLKHWMINNPKYSILKPNPNIIPDQNVNQYTYKPQEIMEMNVRMIEMFQHALKIGPNDPELLTSLGVLFFIKMEYNQAVDLFSAACQLDPTNYSLWNKTGAALAHLGRADEAIKCYHRALDIKPNYVRVWVNLGIAYGYKGEYDEAARFYLNALSFRPDAKHIWAYLQTCFMSMQRYDLIKLIAQQDPHVFTEFEVIKTEDLPLPQIDYSVTTQKHLIGKEASDWTQEFLKQQQ